MRYWNVLFIVGILLLTVCCSDNERLNASLKQAGKNSVELQKVLDHYKNDKEKYRAARFLIENMSQCYSYKGWLLDTLRYLKSTTDSFGNIDNKQVQKWEKYPISMMNKEYDINVITGDYLIRNIDQAFEMWKKRAWNQKLSFDEFCELILPYRIGNETLEDWRSIYYDKFSFLLDSVYTGTNVMEAMNVIVDHLREEGFRFNIDFDTPHMGALFLLDTRAGKCNDICDFMLYVFRSLGIPASTDFYFYASESRMGHTWNVVRDTTGKFVNVSFFNVARTKREWDGRKIGKVHRYYFGIQKDRLEYFKLKDNVPILFRHPYVKDVSGEYFDNKLELNLNNVEANYVYLGVFKSQSAGVGLDIAKQARGKAVFHNIEPEMIYMPLVYENSTYKSIDYPFYFDGENLHKYIPNLSERETVTLYRKNTFFHWVKDWLGMVVGGKFEVADKKVFFKSNIFYSVCDTPLINRNYVHLSKSVSGRYVRFSPAPNIRTELAELSFYYNGTPIKPLKVEGEPSETVFVKVENIIDNDPLTYYRGIKDGSPVIVDFGRKVCFNELVYIPRNDDNFIHIGDVYELFYHAGKEGWVSLGQKKATDTFLIYDNMPKGALFYLHDITRGKEEQVFEIKNGKQFFVSNFGS